jgi:hypothetical protein
MLINTLRKRARAASRLRVLATRTIERSLKTSSTVEHVASLNCVKMLRPVAITTDF